MEKLITGPLAEALERGRERFNARFANERRLNRRLTPDDFAAHLRGVVDPIVRAAAGLAPASVDAVTEALFDLSLELMARDCLGPGSPRPLVNRVWSELLPPLAGRLIESPAVLPAALSNAAYNLSAEPGARPDEWMAGILELAPHCRNADELLKTGQVLAWRSGLAHYRASAIETWTRLGDELKYMVLGLTDPAGRPELDEVFIALSDPWQRPGSAGRKARRKIALAGQAGGFRGFGGPFVCPPEATAADGTIYVYDAEFCWSLHADVFGATFQRYGRDIPPGAGAGGDGEFSLGGDGTVTKGGASTKFAAFKDSTSFASNSHTLAVTLPRSHRVFLVALTDSPEAR